jgi:hypothetical protein
MNDEGFTPEQARLVMLSAGLDPSRSLDEQLQPDTTVLQKRIDDLEARITELTEKRQSQAPAAPEERQRQLAEKLRDGINKSRTPWHAGGTDEAA